MNIYFLHLSASIAVGISSLLAGNSGTTVPAGLATKAGLLLLANKFSSLKDKCILGILYINN